MSEPINDTISPWMPETDPIRLAIYGKMIEELGELTSRAARSIIQGPLEIDPSTGRTNEEEMLREIADVHACINTYLNHFNIVPSDERTFNKVRGFYRWHNMIMFPEAKHE